MNLKGIKKLEWIENLTREDYLAETPFGEFRVDKEFIVKFIPRFETYIMDRSEYIGKGKTLKGAMYEAEVWWKKQIMDCLIIKEDS